MTKCLLWIITITFTEKQLIFKCFDAAKFVRQYFISGSELRIFGRAQRKNRTECGKMSILPGLKQGISLLCHWHIRTPPLHLFGQITPFSLKGSKDYFWTYFKLFPHTRLSPYFWAKSYSICLSSPYSSSSRILPIQSYGGKAFGGVSSTPLDIYEKG